MEYKKLEFGDVMPVGDFNGRLLLRISYKIDEKDIEEQMIVFPDGKYHFRYEGSKLYRYNFNEEISDSDYKLYSKRILKLANKWCELLGWPELTEEI